MNLHSPTFEKALKNGVRKAVRSSPALKREAKKVNRLRKHYSGWWIVRPDGLSIWLPWQKIFRNVAIGFTAAIALGLLAPALKVPLLIADYVHYPLPDACAAALGWQGLSSSLLERDQYS